MSVDPSVREADRELVEAILAGDAGAYRGIVERYQARVYRMLCGMVRDPEEAHDLTQEAFIKAYKNLDRFRLESSFYTWLYRIATNVGIDHIRRRKKRQHSEFDEAVATRDSAGGIDPMHGRDDPGKNLERKQLKDRIFDAMDELSPEHRQIILLREVEGFSYQEIAETMEIPEGTVMSRLFYARRKLQTLLGEELKKGSA